MYQDEIVEKVHRIREAYAERFNYDLQAIYRNLKAQEKESGRMTVALPPETSPQTVGFQITCEKKLRKSS